MPYLEQDLNSVAEEHVIFLHHYGRLQQRCTEQARAQAREIERLQGQIIRLRALVIAHESELRIARIQSSGQTEQLASELSYEKDTI
ncbi:MAG: hypothetical protein WBC18_10650 [Ottowia sp.]|uniref:hypothetical protein n=1 Tax=unclassified Ottowia TaxID=2645081 RepID=UPI003C2EAAAB